MLRRSQKHKHQGLDGVTGGSSVRVGGMSVALSVFVAVASDVMAGVVVPLGVDAASSPVKIDS